MRSLATNIGKVEGAKGKFSVENLPVEKIPLIQATVMGVSNLGETEDTKIMIEFDEPITADKISLVNVEEFPDDVEFDVEYRVEGYV